MIAEAGWADAGELRQQDASELFTFLTGKLELPLLTLKVDLYHTGRDDANDDHKFVNERLLEIPIPPDRVENNAITLEECLEAYFNNHVEVKRYLERQNSNIGKPNPAERDLKTAVAHVECIDESSITSSPVSTPLEINTPEVSTPEIAVSEVQTRAKANSIIQKRWVSEDSDEPLSRQNSNQPPRQLSERKGSIRHEVMMPALQVFSLIPWYADNLSSDDAQTAIHFSQKRPILGMCLKRYDIENGRPVRRNTYVDIPVEIGLPHFIKDDQIDESAPIFGNFKLVLQAVVCHRGNSTDSGHYISLVRNKNPERPASRSSTSSSSECEKTWLRFDDLASERITSVNIEQALREESPYLLFYQILPIDSPPDHDFDERPPDYEGHNFLFNEKLKTDVEALREPSIDEPRNSFSSETFEISHRRSEVNLLIRNIQNSRSKEEIRNKENQGEEPPQEERRTEPLRQNSTLSVSVSRPPSHSRSRPQSQSGIEPRGSGSFFRFSRSGQRPSSTPAIDPSSSQTLAPPKSKRRHRFSNDSQDTTDSRGRSGHRRERSIQKEKDKKEKEKEKEKKKKKKPERECTLM